MGKRLACQETGIVNKELCGKTVSSIYNKIVVGDDLHNIVHTYPLTVNIYRDIRDIISFLGVCGFYHRFIHSFAALPLQLTDFLHKTTTLRWTNFDQKAFDYLKNNMLYYV
ncbi:MAG: hypothetical protein WCG31_06250, partial [Deltaproteobacteria bacterium]